MGTCCGIQWKRHNWHHISWFPTPKCPWAGQREGGSWMLLPSAQLSPAKLLKQLLTSSFRGWWCRCLTPCTCLFKGFILCFKWWLSCFILNLSPSLLCFSAILLTFHRLWAIQLQNWCKLKVVENCDHEFSRISKVRNGPKTLISRTHVGKLYNVEKPTYLHYKFQTSYSMQKLPSQKFPCLNTSQKIALRSE